MKKQNINKEEIINEIKNQLLSEFEKPKEVDSKLSNWVLKIKTSHITPEGKKKVFTDSVVVRARSGKEAVNKFYTNNIANVVVKEVTKLVYEQK